MLAAVLGPCESLGGWGGGGLAGAKTLAWFYEQLLLSLEGQQIDERVARQLAGCGRGLPHVPAPTHAVLRGHGRHVQPWWTSCRREVSLVDFLHTASQTTVHLVSLTAAYF
jgi:hypothetical protein